MATFTGKVKDEEIEVSTEVSNIQKETTINDCKNFKKKIKKRQKRVEKQAAKAVKQSAKVAKQAAKAMRKADSVEKESDLKFSSMEARIAALDRKITDSFPEEKIHKVKRDKDGFIILERRCKDS